MGFRRLLWAGRTVAWNVGKNGLARSSPKAYATLQRLTRDSGRGGGCAGARAAEYFEAVMSDYRVVADASGVGDAFGGKRVLELGPGDTRAIALLAKLAGARSCDGFDAFDIQSRDAAYLEAIYAPLLADKNADAKALLDGCRMHATPESLRERAPYDLVISRAVLEHVRDLRALFRMLAGVVTNDAVLVHKVDLRAHGIEHRHALDFLRFEDATWRAMSSHLDLPNRERIGAYLELAESVGLRTIWAKTTHVIGREDAARVAPSLATRFRDLDPDELRVLGLWLVQVGPKHPLASRPREALGPAPHERLSRH